MNVLRTAIFVLSQPAFGQMHARGKKTAVTNGCIIAMENASGGIDTVVANTCELDL